MTHVDRNTSSRRWVRRSDPSPPHQSLAHFLPAGAFGRVKLGHDSPHLFKTVMNGVGGTPMPAWADILEQDEVWDVVHFIQSLRIAAPMEELKSEELKSAGLAPGDESLARQRLWRELSPATDRSDIDAAVVQTTAQTAQVGTP